MSVNLKSFEEKKRSGKTCVKFTLSVGCKNVINFIEVLWSLGSVHKQKKKSCYVNKSLLLLPDIDLSTITKGLSLRVSLSFEKRPLVPNGNGSHEVEDESCRR